MKLSLGVVESGLKVAECFVLGLQFRICFMVSFVTVVEIWNITNIITPKQFSMTLGIAPTIFFTMPRK